MTRIKKGSVLVTPDGTINRVTKDGFLLTDEEVGGLRCIVLDHAISDEPCEYGTPAHDFAVAFNNSCKEIVSAKIPDRFYKRGGAR